jgi:hypothetical protein
MSSPADIFARVCALVASRKVSRQILTVTVGSVEMTIEDFAPSKRNEDELYTSCEELWRVVPRGCAVASIGGTDVASVFGVPKFGYVGDSLHQDDSDATDFVMLEKENGECFHLAAFRHEGIRYWFGGSKKVHIVVRFDNVVEDLELYQGLRYSFARNMFESFMSCVDLSSRSGLWHFLADRKLTAIAERCSPQFQHMVKYDQECMRWFALNFPHDPLEDGEYGQQMLDVDPFTACSLFKTMGLETPLIINVCNREGVAEQARMAFRMHNSEGGVVYALGPPKKGVAQRVVKMYKSKNATYIILRAVREKLRAGASFETTKKRLETIRDHYPEPVALDSTPGSQPDFVLGIEAKALRFFKWMRVSGFDGSFNDYASRWIAFCTLESEAGPIEYELPEVSDWAGDMPTVVMITGPVGVGKTSLGKALAASTGGVYIDQDECNGIQKLYLKKITKTLESNRVVVIGKTNVNRRMRSMTLGAVKKNFRLFVVEFEGFSPDALIERLEERGLNHPTLRTTPGNDYHLGVLKWFMDNWESWSADEIPTNCASATLVRVPFEQSTRLQAELVLSAMGSGAEVRIFRPTPKFVCVVLPYVEIARLLDGRIPSELEQKKEFHLTLWHVDDGPMPEHLPALVGQSVQVLLIGFAQNARVAAFAAKIPALGEDELHVTAALAKGVKASEAKKLGTTTTVSDDIGADLLGEVVLVAH